MQLKMFSVYDIKAEAYLPPFFLPTVGMAVRTFADCARSKDHQFGKNPEDYILYELGTFDDSSGVVTSDKIKSHGTALSVRGGSHLLAQEDAA